MRQLLPVSGQQRRQICSHLTLAQAPLDMWLSPPCVSSSLTGRLIATSTLNGVGRGWLSGRPMGNTSPPRKTGSWRQPSTLQVGETRRLSGFSLPASALHILSLFIAADWRHEGKQQQQQQKKKPWVCGAVTRKEPHQLLPSHDRLSDDERIHSYRRSDCNEAVAPLCLTNSVWEKSHGALSGSCSLNRAVDWQQGGDILRNTDRSP